MSTPARLGRDRAGAHVPPRPAVTLIGWLIAVWCVGFAVVNIAYERTNHFADGEYADYTAAFTVMNWMVVGLKLLGAVIALLSVTYRPPPIPPRLLGAGVWAVFATLAVYVLGSTVQAVGMMTGLMGSASPDWADTAYLLFFLAAAIGSGVLAISYARRHDLDRSIAALGAVGAPVVLGFLLVVMPTLLDALGVMPSYPSPS